MFLRAGPGPQTHQGCVVTWVGHDFEVSSCRMRGSWSSTIAAMYINACYNTFSARKTRNWKRSLSHIPYLLAHTESVIFLFPFGGICIRSLVISGHSLPTAAPTDRRLFTRMRRCKIRTFGRARSGPATPAAFFEVEWFIYKYIYIYTKM